MLKDTCAFQPAAFFFFFFFKWRHTYDSLGHWVMAGHYKNTEASCHKQVHRWINLLWHLKTLFSKAQRPPAAAVVNSRVGGWGKSLCHESPSNKQKSTFMGNDKPSAWPECLFPAVKCSASPLMGKSVICLGFHPQNVSKENGYYK